MGHVGSKTESLGQIFKKKKKKKKKLFANYRQHFQSNYHDTLSESLDEFENESGLVKN